MLLFLCLNGNYTCLEIITSLSHQKARLATWPFFIMKISDMSAFNHLALLSHQMSRLESFISFTFLGSIMWDCWFYKSWNILSGLTLSSQGFTKRDCRILGSWNILQGLALSGLSEDDDFSQLCHYVLPLLELAGTWLSEVALFELAKRECWNLNPCFSSSIFKASKNTYKNR